ncbi:MAG: DNA-processing protein DprA, partial [Planctomycetes bacterium]|nr:DNA-processing protein DprA [Planctomycetota bacterium]
SCLAGRPAVTTELSRRELRIGLAATRAAGLRELRWLEAAAGGLEACEHAPPARLRLSKGLREAIAGEGLRSRGQRALDNAAACGTEWLVYCDSSYPSRLLALANPPIAICTRGVLPLEDQRSLAVVGSRRCSRYAARSAETFGRELAGRGICVVSGLARGVDAAAHRGSLQAKILDTGPISPTLAVLGCGLDGIYPPEHERLAAEIIAGGGSLVSEFEPGTPPLPAHFPRRNRLIAGLSDGVLLIEAAERSGGLITVRWASDLGRDVFGLPGQVDNPQAAGVLALIRDGVRPIRHVDDLLEDMGWTPEVGPAETPAPRTELRAEEARLLERLDHEGMGIDEILNGLGQSVGQALTTLLALELKGRVEQLPGLRFRRKG